MNNRIHSLWIRNLTTVVVSSALLAGCLSDEKADSSFGSGPATNVELSGSVGDGPVVGANIRVYNQSGVLVAESQSDSTAGYNIVLSAAANDFPLLIEATGGTDLVTDQSPDFKLTAATFDTSGQSIVNLSPFATFAETLTKYLSGGLTANNLEDAQEAVSTALNSGLDRLAATGPTSTPIDEANVSEMVKASETLSEIVRRTRDLMLAAGFAANGDSIVAVLASDLTDGVIDGNGAIDADERTAAVSTLVAAQVLLESMANEVHVNGSLATPAMQRAIEQVSPGVSSTSLDELAVTSGMIAKARIGLAAAFAVDPDPAIRQLHSVVSGLQAGQNATTVRIVLPSGYRNTLGDILNTIASANDATIDLVNSIARTGGDLEADNLAPSIQGVPPTSIRVGAAYTFTPAASDPDGDALTFQISGQPAWTSFDSSTGQLSGTPIASDVATHSNIVIGVTDGEFTTSLMAFSITVTAENTAPQISGSPATSIDAGQAYSFVPSASDAEGDTLTFSIASQPAWAAFDTSTGSLSGTPDNGDAGMYSGITISVSDGEFSDELAAFSITVNAVVSNSPPQISGTPQSTVEEGRSYSFTPTASDADGDSLTFSISSQPSWASFNSTTGQLSGTPGSNDVGTHTGISISVSDGQATAMLGPFSIIVNAVAVNSPPQISGTPSTDVNEGQSYSFTPTASDADGDSLTFSISNMPSWASFDTSTGRLQGTPGSSNVGVYSSVSISVSDGQASASLAPFSITVQAISLGSTTLSWTAPTQNEDGTTMTDLAGYKLYWGTTPGSYPNSVTINNPSVTSYFVDNLVPGTYEFVATSFNTAGVESRYSGTATKVIP